MSTTFKILYFVLKNKWPFGYKFQNFVFRYKKKRMAIWKQFLISHFTVKNEWLFGYNCKILYFAVKIQMAVWVQLQNFVFRCKKKNGRLGTRIVNNLLSC